MKLSQRNIVRYVGFKLDARDLEQPKRGNRRVLALIEIALRLLIARSNVREGYRTVISTDEVSMLLKSEKA